MCDNFQMGVAARFLHSNPPPPLTFIPEHQQGKQWGVKVREYRDFRKFVEYQDLAVFFHGM